MKCHFITYGVSDTLLLIFSGWASDEKFFPMFSNLEQDVCVCFDYRTLEWDVERFGQYREIRVIAWSLGVFVANRILPDSALPVVRAIAINGTIYPCDDEKGIPIAIYEGTEKNLTEENLLKFYRRMCAGAKEYEKLLKLNLSFSIRELQDALRNIRMTQEKKPPLPEKTIFTDVIIGAYDRIFPTANQKLAWGDFPNVRLEGITHYDEGILFVTRDALRVTNGHASQINTAKKLITDRFSKAQTTYDANALAQKEIASQLSALIYEAIPRNYSPCSMFEIGCGTGLLTRILLSRYSFKTVHLNDISDVFASFFSDLKEQYDYDFYVKDAEEIILSRKYDLIVSSSVFQWFDHIPSFLGKIQQHLSPEGIFAFSTFGSQNMREIKELTGTGLDYFSKEEWLELLSGHFQTVQTEENIMQLQLPSPREVLNHLKQTGVNAFKHQATIWTPAKMRQFEQSYRNLFSIGEQVKLTYHPLYFIAKLKKYPPNFQLSTFNFQLK